MGRIIAIDFGRKRCGIAATDSLHIVASAVATVPTGKLTEFICDYARRESIDMIVAGEPRDMHGNPSESTRFIRPALAALQKALPDVRFVRFDERFTSVLAHKAMLDGGLRKKDRADKALVDRISATIILNDFLASRQYHDIISEQ